MSNLETRIKNNPKIKENEVVYISHNTYFNQRYSQYIYLITDEPKK